MIADIISSLLILLGASTSIAAAVGLLRFPDILSRLHAGSKPQVFGLLLILTAIAVQKPTFAVITTLILIATFQMITTPVATHMIGRAAYRTKHLRRAMLYRDELAEAISRADARETARRSEAEAASAKEFLTDDSAQTSKTPEGTEDTEGADQAEAVPAEAESAQAQGAAGIENAGSADRAQSTDRGQPADPEDVSEEVQREAAENLTDDDR